MQIWKAILTEEPDFDISAFSNVSEEAKAFIKSLLNKCAPLTPWAVQVRHRDSLQVHP
jgi:hypothetical protein